MKKDKYRDDREKSDYSSDRSRSHHKHKNKHHKKQKKKHKSHKSQKYHRHRSSSIQQRARHPDKQIKYQHIESKEVKKQQIEQQLLVHQNQQGIEVQKPNFQPSGILLQYYNSRDGVSLKFHEPPEARKPTDEWRIYPFKENQTQNPIILKQSCYLIGKDERICDILCQNPSVSRQHAVIQFRGISRQNIDGTYTETIKPYLMDLQSTNGTHINDERMQPSRYYQILDRDSIKFGLSNRQYVFFKVPALAQQQELQQ